jgi:hypothetical protein
MSQKSKRGLGSENEYLIWKWKAMVRCGDDGHIDTWGMLERNNPIMKWYLSVLVMS